jgi:predicted TPR repeat methyltransferase
MTRRRQTISPEYFEDLYAGDSDPWKFESSDYEREKYAATLAALPAARYGSVLEIGCSIGVLTHQLASRCERLLAIDAASTPLIKARRRCQADEHVEFARMFVPGEWPLGTFDLILLSEVLYYLDAGDLADLAAKVATSLSSHGAVVLVHWTGATNYPLTGDEAASLFIDHLRDGVQIVRVDQQPKYRLDVLVRH